MEAATAIEIAREVVRREGVVDIDDARLAVRQIAQSLIAILPESDDWAVIDSDASEELGVDARRWVLVIDGGFLYRALAMIREHGGWAVTIERLPLNDEARLNIADGEFREDGAVRILRGYTLTVPTADPPHIAYTVDWLREVRERELSREERFGYALAEALDWTLSPVPHELSV